MVEQTMREVLRRASSLLRDSDNNPKIAEWLLMFLLNISYSKYLDCLDDEMSTEQREIYLSWIERVVAGEPYQHITGVEEFYGREFHVSPDVLIPRPETELLVEKAVKYAMKLSQKLKSVNPDRVLHGVDVGTGSGVIAITLALELEQLHIIGIDISTKALEIAQANAKALEAIVTFEQSDVLTSLKQSQHRVDFIISNPPYIPYADKETLPRNVLDFDPHLALFAEEDGLWFYKQTIIQSIEVMNQPGFLAFEVGKGQAESVVELIQEVYPTALCEIIEDYHGIKQMVFAQL